MKNATALKAACVSLLVYPLLLVSEPAIAAMNGQQLQIDTGSGSGNVSVRGTNQNGQSVIWSGRANGTVNIHNWWWKGAVVITVVKDRTTKHYPLGIIRVRRSCPHYVPQSQLWTNWYSVSCKPLG